MKKSVLITGCSSGFGLSLAQELLRRDYQVFATLRNAAARSEIFQEEKKRYPSALHVLSLDVAAESERRSVTEYVRQHAGGEQFVLVNNAGFGMFGAFEDVSDEQLREQFEVNVLGLGLLTRGLLPLLRETRGKLINVSSILGLCAAPLCSLYCSSKFALEGLSESLYYELRPYGVQVCIVEPGGYSTHFGNNVHWAGDDGSIYAAKVKRYRNKFTTKFRPSGPDPVGSKLADLIERERLPLRKRLGWDAKFLYALRTVLPAPIYSAFFYNAVRAMYYRD